MRTPRKPVPTTPSIAAWRFSLSRRSRRSRLSLLSLLPVLGLGGGCSFVFVDGPPAQHRQLPYLECTPKYTAPILDTVWGGLSLAVAMVAYADANDANPGEGAKEAAVGQLLAAAVYGASAWYGYSNVGDCRQARAELLNRVNGTAPWSVGPGVPPPGNRPPVLRWPPPAWPPPPGTPPPAPAPSSPPATPPAAPSPATPPASPAPPPTPPAPLPSGPTPAPN